MKKGNRKSFNKGFTLVELICVLVVLAVIAAVLVPSLLGYILKVNQKKEINNARTLLEATQAQLVELYAAQGVPPEDTPIIPSNCSDNDNRDRDITNTTFVKDVLNLVSMEGYSKNNKNGKPYLFMVAVGSNAKNTAKITKNRVSDHDKYTVYYAVYMETEKSNPIYYYNGEWTNDNPRPDSGVIIFDKQNVVSSGPLKGMRLQYYLMVNGANKSLYNNEFWKWLKGKSVYN